MKTELDRLRVEELAQLKWLLGSVLTLLSLWSLWSLQFSLEGLIVSAALVVFGVLWRPQLIARVPAWVWKFAGPLLLVWITADFAINMPRNAEFLPPLVRMVMLLLIFRCLAPRQRREDLQLILLCLFCVILAGVLSVSLLFAVQILLFMPIAMGLLFVICLLRDSGREEPDQVFGKDYRMGDLFRRVFAVLDYKLLSFGAVLFACMVVVSTFIFILMPRFNLEQAIPFLQLSAESKSGFRSNVQLGDVTEITQDNSVALRIDVPSLEAIKERPYWRMLVLDRYSDGFFQTSTDGASNSRMDISRRESRVSGAWERWPLASSDRSGAIWTFYLEGGISQYLPLPGNYHQLRFPGAKVFLQNESLRTISMDVVQQSVLSYQLEDLQWSSSLPASSAEVSAFSRANQESLVQLDPDEVSYPMTNLQLSLSESDRSYLETVNAVLIEGLSGRDTSRYGQRLVQYLASEHRYSLRPEKGAGVGDEVVNWLRSGGVGHCEYFAGAMVLLARDAGFPARMAVGFAGGSWNSVEEYFVVRNSNAHAWVEMYDAASESWLRFDPTPNSDYSDSGASLAEQVSVDVGWNAWIDSLRIQWYRRVVNFDQDDQLELAESAKGFFENLSEALSDSIRTVVDQIKSWWASILATGAWWRLLPIAWSLGFIWALFKGFQLIRRNGFRFWKRGQRLELNRRKAGAWLKKMQSKEQKLAFRNRPIPEGWRLARRKLEAIRFGPKLSRKEALTLFAECKKLF